jgi:ATP-binding cassette, subfamily A (ABC1), member 3
MANGRLRCLGSAQHLKDKFGQGFQIELKVSEIDPADTDYVENALSLSPSQVQVDPSGEAVTENLENVFLNLDGAVAALESLTGDSFLSSMVNPDSPTGFSIWKEATSAAGCPLDELAAFATTELRIRNVEDYIKSSYPGYVLRDRQDSKVRYEIPSAGERISDIFASIEKNKDRLRISDYGVSQTSLEQVFNMHAAEAEHQKQGRNDG